MEFCDSNEILPPNWIKKGSKSHPDKFYFHNTVTKKSVWKLSDLPLQPTNKEKSKVTTPNKQFTSLSHGSKTIKKNLAENRLSKLNTVLSKEVIEEIKKDQRKLSQNNGTTSEKPRSGQKCNVSSSLPRDFIYKKPVAKKNLSQQRLDFIKSAVDSAEPEQSQVTSSAKRKSEPSVNNDVFLPKRLTTIKDSPEIITSNRTATSSYNKDNSPKKSVASNYSKDSSNFNTSDRSTTSSHNKNSSSSKRLVASNYNKNNYDNFTPKRSETSSNDTDNSARKILHSSKKSVQDRLNMNSDVLMLDVSRDITTEETDDKMDWEEIPVEKIVETVQNVRNNTDSSCMSSNDVIRTSHRNIQHSEDHFYCVIDTNVFLSNLDFIKSLIGRNFHSKLQTILN